MIGRPNFLAVDLLAKTTAAAPSETWELFPAVVVPVGLKAGFSFARLSSVVYFLIPSSSETTTYFFSLPSLSLIFVLTATI